MRFNFKGEGLDGSGIAVYIIVMLLFVILATIYAYFSFRGLTKLGVCSDRILPWVLKFWANSLTGGILGIVMYFVGADKVPVKTK